MSFRKQPANEVLLPKLKAWFDSELGQELLMREQELAAQIIPTLFGMHFVQFGIDPRINFFAESPVTHCFSVVPELELGLAENNIVASNTDIPLAHESVDVVLLHHALDFTDSPHQVLREAARILRPGGHLIVVGFNPFSSWGIYRFFSRNKANPPWCGHFISHRRLSDWFKLLELTELKNLSGYHRPPFESIRWRNRFSCLERWARKGPALNGGFSVLLARKDIAGMTPLRSGWGLRRLINLPVVEPSTRGSLRKSRESR